MSIIRNVRTPKQATVVVDPVVGRGDCTTIEEAFSLLPTNGGTIYIKKGIYTINSKLIVGTKTIRLIGESSQWSTNVSLVSSLSRVFELYDYGNIIIENISLSNSVDGVVWFYIFSGNGFVYLNDSNIETNGANSIMFDQGVGWLYVNMSNCYMKASSNSYVTKKATISATQCSFYGYCGDASLAPRLLLSYCDWSTAGASVKCDMSKIVGCSFVGDLEIKGFGESYVSSSSAITLTVKGTKSILSNIRVTSLAVEGSYNVFSGILFNTIGSIVEAGSANYNSYSGIPSSAIGSSIVIKLVGDNSTVEGNRIFTTSTDVTLYSQLAPCCLTILVDASLGLRTITLPAASDYKNKEVTVKKIDVSANIARIAGGGANVDGSSSYDLTAQYQSVTVQSDGTNWKILCSYNPLVAGVQKYVNLLGATTDAYVQQYDHTGTNGLLGNGTVVNIADTGWLEATPSGAIDRNWQCCAADGNKMLAGVNAGGWGRLYRSLDGGLTWSEVTPAGASSYGWCCCGVSGSNMLAGIFGGRIYRSTDSGASWSEVTPAGAADKFWFGCAVSGSVMLAGDYGGRLYLSTDSGATWGEATPAGAVNKDWAICAVSGTNLLAGILGGRIYRSTNTGGSWSEVTPAGAADMLWNACAVSGSVMMAAVWGGRLYLSTDSGGTWGEATPAGAADKTWQCCGANGNVLMAGIGPGRLYLSTNTGGSWSEQQPAGAVDKFWGNCAVSSITMIAGVFNGRLYYDRYNSTALLTVRRTVTDLFATAGATKENVVGPGASFSYSWDDLIGAALPPYTDVKVEIKSTTPGDPAAFKIAASTQ